MRRARIVGWVLALGAAAAGSESVLELVRPRGVNFVLRNSPTSQKYLMETMCGGVALLDYNNDGRLDIFLVNGGRLPEVVKGRSDFARSEPAYWNRLYRQNPDGGFSDVTEAAGLNRAGESNFGMGV